MLFNAQPVSNKFRRPRTCKLYMDAPLVSARRAEFYSQARTYTR